MMDSHQIPPAVADDELLSPQIRPHPDRPGLRIVDPIESVQYPLFTDRAVSPSPVEWDAAVPVDVAVTVEVGELVIPQLLFLCLRDLEMTPRATVQPEQSSAGFSVDPGEHLLEVGGAPVKLYVRTDTGFEANLRRGEQKEVLVFDEPATVTIGCRSLHERPATTIRVTDDPEDVMAGLSYFGSALKTTSPERSFPTLRGHPPLLERGPSLRIPESLDRPDTDVSLEIPPEFEYVHPVASLAFYLGADVIPGSEPRLVAGEFSYSLSRQPRFDATVNRLLKRLFYLDCVVRSEGLYPVDLQATHDVEAIVGEVDFGPLYESSLAERVAEYLSPRFDPIVEEGLLPEWHVTADIEPAPERAAMLPYLAADLACIRVPERTDPPVEAEEPDQLANFYRGSDSTKDADAGRGESPEAPVESFVGLRDAEGDRLWIGDGYPIGGVKPLPEACRRRLDHVPPDPEDHTISIRVVCMEPSMREEVGSSIYVAQSPRELLDFDIDIHYELTTGELRELLSDPADFLHYVGHVDEEGFRCADGYLDARTLDSVAVRSFFLNACRSYEQGRALVDAGSFAGVATLGEIGNNLATRSGRALARLLNAGLPLRTGLRILQDHSMIGHRYTVLGDGGLQLVQADGTCPEKAVIERRDDDSYDLTVDFYPTGRFGAGTTMSLHIPAFDRHYLVPGRAGPERVSAAGLTEWISLDPGPVEIDGELRWGTDLDLIDSNSE